MEVEKEEVEKEEAQSHGAKGGKGVESESRGEEKEEAMGPGGGLPSYRRDPAKILRDLSTASGRARIFLRRV